jgi:hypothetical protein
MKSLTLFLATFGKLFTDVLKMRTVNFLFADLRLKTNIILKPQYMF